MGNSVSRGDEAVQSRTSRYFENGEADLWHDCEIDLRLRKVNIEKVSQFIANLSDVKREAKKVMKTFTVNQ